MTPRRIAFTGCLIAAALGAGPAARAVSAEAAALLLRHTEVSASLVDNQFDRPLVLGSSVPSGRLQGDVYARVDRPFAEVRGALDRMDHWCDILILHMNVKACRASAAEAGDQLRLHVGHKTDQALADAERFDFRFTERAADPDYLHVTLAAAKGPLGTSQYLIVIEAVALDAERSFIHLSYSYAYGFTARLALRGYLATSGRDKVGFSVIGHDAAGQPIHLGGLRGVVERNTMRYFLAIEAYLGALALPAAERSERRIADWYTSVERYPLQLHELEREAYVAMKRREVTRQAALGPLVAGE